MSVEATSWVWTHSQSKGTARLVLLRIADQADKHGANAWPGVDTIQADVRVSKRDTVTDAIKWLIAAGELVVFLNEGGNHRTRNDRRPNRYDLPKVPGYEPPEGLEPWDPTTPRKTGTREMGTTPQKTGPRPPKKRADDPPSDGGGSISDPSGTTPSGDKSPRRRGTKAERDSVWDNLVALDGITDSRQIPESRRSHYGRMVTELIQVGATGDLVAFKARRYAEMHPTWDRTAAALVKHWASIPGPVERAETVPAEIVVDDGSQPRLDGMAAAGLAAMRERMDPGR